MRAFATPPLLSSILATSSFSVSEVSLLLSFFSFLSSELCDFLLWLIFAQAAAALRVNRTLHTLMLEGNELGDKGACSIAQVCAPQDTLTRPRNCGCTEPRKRKDTASRVRAQNGNSRLEGRFSRLNPWKETGNQRALCLSRREQHKTSMTRAFL